MNELTEFLAGELGRPRPLPPQVTRHLGAAYGLGRDEAGDFLDSRLASLAEDEQDLVLAPMFTPKLADQGRVARLLLGRSVPSRDWTVIVDSLLARPARGTLLTEDGTPHGLDLPRVAIERFVHRLRLDGSIPDSRLSRIAGTFPEDTGGIVLAVARRATWEHPGHAAILDHFLARAATEGATAADAEQLLILVESYEPADLGELRERMPRWRDILRQQIQDGELPKPFFNEQVAELHGGGRDQRGTAAAQVDRQRAELAALDRLQHLLG